MNDHIRAVEQKDLAAWVAMRSDLWPDSQDQHQAELQAYFAGDAIDIDRCYVVVNEAGEVGGFIELNIRNFAEGSRQPAVPYVEGWYVAPAFRGQRLGLALMQRAEQWAVDLGYTELASDTEIDNHKSLALHQQMGFVETERVICLLKKLH